MVVLLMSYIILVFAAFKLLGNDISISSPVDLFLVLILPAIPACYILHKTEQLPVKYGLVCKNCNYKFQHPKPLMHAAFTNQCPKCKTNVYSA